MRDQWNLIGRTFVDGVVTGSSDHYIRGRIQIGSGPMLDPAFRRTSGRTSWGNTANINSRITRPQTSNRRAVPRQFLTVTGRADHNAAPAGALVIRRRISDEPRLGHHSRGKVGKRASLIFAGDEDQVISRSYILLYLSFFNTVMIEVSMNHNLDSFWRAKQIHQPTA